LSVQGAPEPAKCGIDAIGLSCMLAASTGASYQTYQTNKAARPAGNQLVYTFDVRTDFDTDAPVLAMDKPISIAQFAWGDGRDQARIQLIKGPNDGPVQIMMATPSTTLKSDAVTVTFDTKRAHRIRVTLDDKIAQLFLDGSTTGLQLDVSKSLPGTFVFLAQLGPFFPAGSPLGLTVVYHRFLAETCNR
jgi:hypothetical protein